MMIDFKDVISEMKGKYMWGFVKVDRMDVIEVGKQKSVSW